jgi:hypothetical protein
MYLPILLHGKQINKDGRTHGGWHLINATPLHRMHYHWETRTAGQRDQTVLLFTTLQVRVHIDLLVLLHRHSKWCFPTAWWDRSIRTIRRRKSTRLACNSNIDEMGVFLDNYSFPTVRWDSFLRTAHRQEPLRGWWDRSIQTAYLWEMI